jgi:hypothetical protein
MSDDFDGNDVEQMVQAALGELLNIAASVAELQMTDEAAEEIYTICDLVAEYYQIERARAITEEHEDGSFTTRFETFTGGGDLHSDTPAAKTKLPIPGSIRTAGKPKLRLIDCDIPPAANKNKNDTEPDEDED